MGKTWHSQTVYCTICNRSCHNTNPNPNHIHCTYTTNPNHSLLYRLVTGIKSVIDKHINKSINHLVIKFISCNHTTISTTTKKWEHSYPFSATGNDCADVSWWRRGMWWVLYDKRDDRSLLPLCRRVLSAIVITIMFTLITILLFTK